MLSYLKFDDDGAMTFADFDGAWKYFYHDATTTTPVGPLIPHQFAETAFPVVNSLV